MADKSIYKAEFFNYKTGQTDRRGQDILNWQDYLPQDTATQGLYEVYKKLGDTPRQAAKKVLLRITATPKGRTDQALWDKAEKD